MERGWPAEGGTESSKCKHNSHLVTTELKKKSQYHTNILMERVMWCIYFFPTQMEKMTKQINTTNLYFY